MHASPVDNRRLGADVDRHSEAAGHGDVVDAGIGDEQRVRLYALEERQILLQPCKLRVMGISVERHIELLAQGVGVADGFRQLFVGKISGKSAQAKGLAGAIHSIRPVMQGEAQLFKISGRCQKFNVLFHCDPPVSLPKQARRHPAAAACAQTAHPAAHPGGTASSAQRPFSVGGSDKRLRRARR